MSGVSFILVLPVLLGFDYYNILFNDIFVNLFIFSFSLLVFYLIHSVNVPPLTISGIIIFALLSYGFMRNISNLYYRTDQSVSIDNTYGENFINYHFLNEKPKGLLPFPFISKFHKKYFGGLLKQNIDYRLDLSDYDFSVKDLEFKDTLKSKYILADRTIIEETLIFSKQDNTKTTFYKVMKRQ